MKMTRFKIRVGIVGSRRRNKQKDYKQVEETFISVFKRGETMIISGGCPRGGDRFAEIIASALTVPKRIFPPNWKLGRHAGFLRNTKIARWSTVLIACVAQDRKGGTEDTIKKFKKFHPEGKLILCEDKRKVVR